MGKGSVLIDRRVTVSHKKNADKCESPTPSKKKRVQIIDGFGRYSKCPELLPHTVTDA